jgi:hypothetical protein
MFSDRIDSIPIQKLLGIQVVHGIYVEDWAPFYKGIFIRSSSTTSQPMREEVGTRLRFVVVAEIINAPWRWKSASCPSRRLASKNSPQT